MIRHTVMWKFKENTEKEMYEFVNALKSLYGVIPQIKKMDAGIDIGINGNYSAVLICDFESIEDLETYKSDPRHVKVSDLCKAIRKDRTCVDYEY